MRAKGLEFRAVAVMAGDDEVILLKSRIETVAEDSDLEEVYNTARHLRYSPAPGAGSSACQRHGAGVRVFGGFSGDSCCRLQQRVLTYRLTMKLRRLSKEGTWQILAACTEHGDCPLTDFLSGLGSEMKASVNGILALLDIETD